MFPFKIRLPLLLNACQNWTLFYSENKTPLKKIKVIAFEKTVIQFFSRFSSDMRGDFARVTT